MYQLYIANKNYSSWSLRPWVLMQTLGIEFEECMEGFESADNFEKFRKFSPSGTVPCLQDGDLTVWDSLAIAEYLAETHQEVWPEDIKARTFARCVTAEMHSSFSHLRNLCPMNCAITVDMHEISAGLQRNLDRIGEIFVSGIETFGGPFLAGDKFSAADAFFCPVAFRVRSYQLPLPAIALSYCERLLALPAMQAWDEAGVNESWKEEAHEEEAAAAGKIVWDRRSS
ncbi:MAG: glutathione S-transferase family protein [Pseudomonadales bacterium]|nr:glutathione S-transferase family protein [Pseudomonadales bacterium]MBO6563515.1 glutathione S-transferase family protein [Pseudomonadales bacterium]MBO6596829.1 glutathione S-transferase family protein [Pseudomonadales bacterium]MBO6659013.1 glutathione S-transferase family protein [Pseudomonadales bacterium]MBO6703500.1 glutathione S-transferase family protein [Pseudomonadales bacterium]